jgi:DNA mismatch repair protein MutL
MIATLPRALRDRIAAGEVVTRPARVVAELVDNALDADADRVTVAVDGGGRERIRVEDDGRGMSREDAPRALERYATSKVTTADEFESLDTLGFRGEALAAVASVSRLELVTNDGGPRGTRVVADEVDDRDPHVEPAGRARGTTVVVSDLFYNRPPRRESLAGPATEFARISSLVARYALARPDVRFRLVHDGSVVFTTPGTGLRDALVAVYDRETAGESTTFEASAAVSDTAGTGQFDVAISGALCSPAVTRASDDHVRVAVNGRPVSAPDLTRAAERGYGSLLPGGRHPVAVVAVELPPQAVDPNVDPAKERVALRASDEVVDAVETAVRDALSTADLRRRAETSMDLDAGVAPVASRFDDLTYVGQFRDTYLLCEDGDDLLVVDQHAAHERVNYERLRAALDEAVPSRDVDPPATLSLSPGAAAAVEEHHDALERMGFGVEPFGGSAVRVTAVPAPFGRQAAPESLRDALAALDAGDDADPRQTVAADLACHPSLKAGDALDDDAARTLLDRLGACETPYACPHGRPTVLAIDAATLADGFERS